MIEINFEIKKGDKHPRNGIGKHAFIYRGKELNDLAKKYGRENEKLCLKIFYDSPTMKWGDNPRKDQPRKNTNLDEATVIQNIAAWYNLAPRVYALFEIMYNGRKVYAQLTQDLGKCEVENDRDHSKAIEVCEAVNRVCERFGIVRHDFDVSCFDEIGGKLIDFQGFSLGDDFREKVAEFYKVKTAWGSRYYQRVPELGLHGSPRKLDVRLEAMKIDAIDFQGKTFADFGCNGGDFVRQAIDRGAKRAIGIDLPDAAHGAHVVSMLLGYYNADFIGKDISKEKFLHIDDEKGTWHLPDIVFYLSMIRHTGLPEWLVELPNELLVIEWNNGITEKLLAMWVDSKFKFYKMVGRSSDHGDKPYWWCSNTKEIL